MGIALISIDSKKRGVLNTLSDYQQLGIPIPGRNNTILGTYVSDNQ